MKSNLIGCFHFNWACYNDRLFLALFILFNGSWAWCHLPPWMEIVTRPICLAWQFRKAAICLAPHPNFCFYHRICSSGSQCHPSIRVQNWLWCFQHWPLGRSLYIKKPPVKYHAWLGFLVTHSRLGNFWLHRPLFLFGLSWNIFKNFRKSIANSTKLIRTCQNRSVLLQA